jgi:hypothetical protein
VPMSVFRRPRKPADRDRGQDIGRARYDLFDLDAPLLELPSREWWTARDACNGVQVFGAIGSGKTSGSGAALARAMLARGFGGLVLCAKSDECALWEEYAAATGRSADLLIVRPVDPTRACRFNYMEWELSRSGRADGLTQNLVNLFAVIGEIIEQRAADEGPDFWDRSMQELLRNAIDVIAHTGSPLSLETVARMVISAPKSAAEVESEQWWSSSFCASLLSEAHRAPKDAATKHDYDIAVRYWLEVFPNIADKTRSGIVQTFGSMADVLTRGLLYRMLGTETELTPEVAFRSRKVIVLDMPVQRYGDVGRIAQGIWKYCFQKAIERRDIAQFPLPCFLWADEAQNFVSSYDFRYQAECRSKRGMTIYLTQNISNYYAVLGNRDQANSLLGNFQTKIFHANGDAPTNTYASDVIAGRWMRIVSTGGGQDATGNPTSSFNVTESIQTEVLPSEFTTLRTGGPANAREVDAIFFQGGKRFLANQGKPYLRLVFEQT